MYGISIYPAIFDILQNSMIFASIITHKPTISMRAAPISFNPKNRIDQVAFNIS
jgi:hypothetical protein